MKIGENVETDQAGQSQVDFGYNEFWFFPCNKSINIQPAKELLLSAIIGGCCHYEPLPDHLQGFLHQLPDSSNVRYKRLAALE